MYKDDVKDLYSQKREALTLFLSDSLIVLLKLYILMPKNIKERKQFINVIKSYIKYNNDEKEILGIIKRKYGKIDELEFIDIILDELDDLFEIIYDNYQDILNDYEDMIITKDEYRAIIPKDKILGLNLEVKQRYINQLGGK